MQIRNKEHPVRQNENPQVPQVSIRSRGPDAPTAQAPNANASNAEFPNTNHTLAQTVTIQVGRQGILDTCRNHKFFSINPPEFIGSKLNENQESFIDLVQKIFQVMHGDVIESVELAS